MDDHIVGLMLKNSTISIFDLKDIVGQIVFPLNTEETISCVSFLSLGFEK